MADFSLTRRFPEDKGSFIVALFDLASSRMAVLTTAAAVAYRRRNVVTNVQIIIITWCSHLKRKFLVMVHTTRIFMNNSHVVFEAFQIKK